MKNFSELPKTWPNLNSAKIELQKKLPNWENPQTYLEIQELQNLISIWTIYLVKNGD